MNRIHIDWSQPSTIRGAIWLASALLAIVISLIGDKELAGTVFVSGAALAGGIGMAVTDKPTDKTHEGR